MRSDQRHESARPRRRRGLLLAALLAAAVALSAGAPAAASASPYMRELSQASAHLRMAIEIKPAQLGEHLGSSEVVCGLGEAAANRGDVGSAEADWNTLSQLVDELDRPDLAGIDAAFVRADASLVELRRHFERAWRKQPQQVRELRRGVADTRRGIARLRQAMARVGTGVGRWDSHDCAGARAGILAGARAISPGLEVVNRGMERLWGLG